MVQKLKVCVIGGSGFIGINLCIFLSKIGCEVTAAARTGKSLNYMKRMFQKSSCIIRIVKIDSIDDANIKKFVDICPRFDLVVNATGYAVQRDQSDVNYAHEINSILPLRLIKAFDGKACRFINLGTSYEYGNSIGKLSESSKTLPQSLYGITKLRGTNAILDCELKSIKLICLRLFGTFGPYESLTKLFPLLFSVHFEGNYVNFSHGKQKVDYSHIENVCDVIFYLLINGFKEDKELYNIGSGIAYSIRDISEIFKIYSGLEREIEWGKENVRMSTEHLQYADISKIKQIGWRPMISLEQGVSRFIELHKNQEQRRNC